METAEIREARPEDAEKILAFSRKVGGETDNLSFGAEGIAMTVTQERQYLRRVHEELSSLFLCAWKGDELVGTGNLSALPRRMSHRVELGLAVARAEWGQGIGSALLERLIEHARQTGTEIISLEVRSDNHRAIRLYERYGFRRIGTFPASFRIDGKYFDFELMYLDLR